MAANHQKIRFSNQSMIFFFNSAISGVPVVMEGTDRVGGISMALSYSSNSIFRVIPLSDTMQFMVRTFTHLAVEDCWKDDLPSIVLPRS